jgi:uncharacterized protein (TIGR02271 family)
MSNTVIGLYRTDADVQRVVEDLAQHGFSRHEINHYDEVHSGLRDWFAEQGVPASEAEDYLLGIRNGGKIVALEADDDRAREALEIMRRHEQGGSDYGVDGTTTGGATAGTTDRGAVRGAGTTRETGRARTEGHGTEERLEVVEEELEVGTRQVEGGGVRARTYVTERPVEKDVKVREEHVDVQRRPVDRPLRPGETEGAFQERTIEASERSEEVVVGKRARVIEEIVLTKDVGERTETVRDTVRKTEVDVERDDSVRGKGKAKGHAFDREHFQGHHRETFAGSEYGFGDYEPAYRFGTNLATHPDHRGQGWRSVEATAREHWERQNPGTWSDFQGAIRYGYERSGERATKR